MLFSDEKCFYGKGFCGRMWVRREKGTALEPQYTVHKTAHPVKVNVWACFCANGQGYCHIFNDNLDAVLMKKILGDNLLPSAQLHFSFDPPEQWYLLHDSLKKFSSRLVTEQLHTLGAACPSSTSRPTRPTSTPSRTLGDHDARSRAAPVRDDGAAAGRHRGRVGQTQQGVDAQARSQHAQAM